MTIKPLFLAVGIGAALGGCVSSTTDQAAAPRPATAEAAALADLGIDVAKAGDQVAGVGTGNAVDAGLAVGMTQSFGAPGLVGGVMGWLAGPGAGMAGDPHLFVTIPAGQDRRALERRYAESFYAMTGLNLQAEGYGRVTEPRLPTAVTFARPGCPLRRQGYYDASCSVTFRAEIYRPQGGGPGAAHLVRFLAIGRPMPDPLTIQKRMADRHPELALYLPPRREGGRQAGPSLYRNGRTTPL